MRVSFLSLALDDELIGRWVEMYHL
jgi:hypothetical protein